MNTQSLRSRVVKEVSPELYRGEVERAIKEKFEEVKKEVREFQEHLVKTGKEETFRSHKFSVKMGKMVELVVHEEFEVDITVNLGCHNIVRFELDGEIIGEEKIYQVVKEDYLRELERLVRMLDYLNRRLASMETGETFEHSVGEEGAFFEEVFELLFVVLFRDEYLEKDAEKDTEELYRVLAEIREATPWKEFEEQIIHVADYETCVTYGGFRIGNVWLRQEDYFMSLEISNLGLAKFRIGIGSLDQFKGDWMGVMKTNNPVCRIVTKRLLNYGK